MKRALAALLLSGGTTVLLASPAAAQPISEPASCQGYLASWANPNYAFILTELVRPAAEDSGLNVGQLLSPQAKTHNGSLDGCIPD
jgi:hypothetical protein